MAEAEDHDDRGAGAAVRVAAGTTRAAVEVRVLDDDRVEPVRERLPRQPPVGAAGGRLRGPSALLKLDLSDNGLAALPAARWRVSTVPRTVSAVRRLPLAIDELLLKASRALPPTNVEHPERVRLGVVRYARTRTR